MLKLWFSILLLCASYVSVNSYCLNGQFECDPTQDTTLCIDSSKLCDGTNDCEVSGKDELLCGSPTQVDDCKALNPAYDFTCYCNEDNSCGATAAPGTCVRKGQLCDGVMDCTNGLDEKYCGDCKDFEFRCDHNAPNGRQCLTRFQICDGSTECTDLSDEANALGCSFSTAGALSGPCNANSVECTDNGEATCHSKAAQVCRSIGSTCSDLDRGCPPVADNQFLCDDGSNILYRDKLCNGFDDCDDASDEDDCTFATACTAIEQVSCLGGGTGDKDVCIDVEDLCKPANFAQYTSCVETTAYVATNSFCPYTCDAVAIASCGVAEQYGLCVATSSTTSTDFQCSCLNGFVHPVMADGSIDQKKCGLPCNVADCVDNGAISCKGTTGASNFVCYCEHGYVQNPTKNGCEVAQCVADIDCNPEGVNFFTCGMGVTGQCDCSSTSYDGTEKYCRFVSNDNCPSVANCAGASCTPTANNAQDYFCGDCPAGYTHPVDNNGMVDTHFCKERCDDHQCGIDASTLLATGKCSGTKDDFICACTDVGSNVYVHPDNGHGHINRRICDLPCNVMMQCGSEGALACNGTQTIYSCLCKSNYGHAGNNRNCVEKCTATTDFKSICGSYSNACTMGEFVTSPTFCCCEHNSKNVNGKCIDECMTDLLSACGNGASGCTGSLSTPTTCTCAEGYHLHGGKCEELHCSDRASNPCLNGECDGGYWSWTCKCDEADGYVFDEIKRCCVEVGCQNSQCGAGYIHGVWTNYASSCSMLDDDRTCTCIEGFLPARSETGQMCQLGPCSNNQCSLDGVSLTDGTCFGDSIHHTCICADGFELMEIQRFKDQPKSKVCAPIDCSKSNEVLCNGHGYCVGSVVDHTCHCKPGFINPDDAGSPGDLDLKSCVPSRCTLAQCGDGATGCSFANTGTSHNAMLRCECDTFGYETSPDGDKCEKIQCNSYNFLEACKEGAVSCTGPILTPICACDSAHHYYPSGGFRSCQSSCRHNEEVYQRCGPQNSCSGTYKHYVCVCNAAGFTSNPDDPTICDEIHCDGFYDSLSSYDIAQHACGKGALSCIGTWAHPKCQCDTANNYCPSSDGKKCVQDVCTNNHNARQQCRFDVGNSCGGPFNNFACKCEAKGFKASADGKSCEEISCGMATNSMTEHEVAEYACGKGASSCSGTIHNPHCYCDKDNYYLPADDFKSCVSESCKNYPEVAEACGVGNSCRGGRGNFICVCSGIGYEYDPSNNQVCNALPCDYNNAIEVCGDGASGCSGTVREPVCECTSGNVATPDGTKCVSQNEAGCLLSEEAQHNCGGGNTCHGTFSNYVCICSAYGFAQDPNDASKCIKIACVMDNAIDRCGKGAVDCSGYLVKPVCQCDKTNHYIPSNDLTTCVKESCQNNPLAVSQCLGNDCRGTFDVFECICTRKGYLQNPQDKTECLEASCESTTNYVEVCGPGAIMCHGLVRAPSCECDLLNGYIPSNNGYSCVPASCRDNPLALAQCGRDNGCKGTYKSWVCICTAKGYQNHASNLQMCEETPCTTGNALEFCGEGATDCTGPASNPKCYCDTNRDYVASADGNKCVLADCRSAVASNDCGPGNTCRGSVKSWQCMCTARGWEIDPSNAKTCIRTLCTMDNAELACGEGATGCSGFLNQPTCECDAKKNFVPFERGHKCIHSDCRNSMEVIKMCGPGNSCQGSFKNYQCICNGKGYVADPGNSAVCLEVMCQADWTIAQVKEVCGTGAITCEGPAREPKCNCDVEKYIPSPNGQACLKADCQNSLDVLKACGKGNGCTGTIDNFACICTAYGYEAVKDNVQICAIRQCSDLTLAESKVVCGDGSTGCTGSVLNPTCVCDTTSYQQSFDKHSCQPMDCKYDANIVANCKGNPCKGTVFSHECVCQGPAYVTDPNDERTCSDALCSIAQCGMDPMGGPLAYLASKCTGLYKAPVCECITGYEITGYGVEFCKVKACDDAECAGGIGGSCHGDFFDWYCKCDEPNFVPTADKKGCEAGPCVIEQCGNGYIHGKLENFAIGCTGTYKAPVCECRTDDGFQEIGGLCEIKPCDVHPRGKCNGGTCKDDWFHFTCDCSITSPPGLTLEVVPGDHRACKPSPCILSQCGSDTTEVDNAVLTYYFADRCFGTVDDPVCICKTGYLFDVDAKVCKQASCTLRGEKQCGGHGTCTGPYFDHDCVCETLYHVEDTEANVPICVPDSCTEIKPECGGHGDCVGTVAQFICNCDANWEQDVSGMYPTCVESPCRHDQCGGTADAPFGICTGTLSQYTCSCNDPGFAQPMLPGGPIVTQCDYKCKEEQCNIGGVGVTECAGTVNLFTCTCAETSHTHPEDINKNKIVTMCREKCDDKQCSPEEDDATRGTCSGTKSQYTCDCSDILDYANPMDKDCKPIMTICKEKCSHIQCGKYDFENTDVATGECLGTKDNYVCTCEDGFEFALDDSKQEVKTICIDIDECKTGDHDCGINALCKNTIGGFECECESERYTLIVYKTDTLPMQGCFLNQGWGPYAYTECSQTCGQGTMTKTRACLVDDGICEGSNQDIVPCIAKECQVPSEECSVQRGGPNADDCYCPTIESFPLEVNEEDFEFTTDGVRYNIQQLKGSLKYWTDIANTNLCDDAKYDDEKRNEIETKITEFLETLGPMKDALDAHKEKLRLFVECSNTKETTTSLFALYYKAINDGVLLKFVHKDIAMEMKKIEHQLKKCHPRAKGDVKGEWFDWLDDAFDYSFDKKE